jgi:hypothetical protein
MISSALRTPDTSSAFRTIDCESENETVFSSQRDPSRGKGAVAYGSSSHPTLELAMSEITIGTSAEIWDHCARRPARRVAIADARLAGGSVAKVLMPSAVCCSAMILRVPSTTMRRRKEVDPQSQLRKT